MNIETGFSLLLLIWTVRVRSECIRDINAPPMHVMGDLALCKNVFILIRFQQPEVIERIFQDLFSIKYSVSLFSCIGAIVTQRREQAQERL